MENVGKSKPLSWWLSVLIVVSSTLAAFWIFGGQHYLTHRYEIEHSLFTHEDEAEDPVRWVSWLFQTGIASGVGGFVVSTVLVAMRDKKQKRNP